MRRPTRIFLGAAAAALALLTTAAPAGAHPLGNVSVNHHAGLVIGGDSIDVDYVVDFAELPTVRERQSMDADRDDEVDDSERAAHAGSRCDELAAGLDVSIDGRRIPVSSLGGDARFLPGEAGLETLRLECDLRAAAGVAADATEIRFTDSNPSGRGWREVTAVGDGVTLSLSTVPETSPSERLTDYPDGPLADIRAAEVVASPGGAPAPSVGSLPFGGQARAATDRFTSLVAADEVTVPLVATSLVVAVFFGALHSLAPGHGKSVIAAYLLGQRRDRRLAVMLGGTVALTHTASVLAFGAVISVTEAAAPDRFYPAFGVLSGLLFVALGIALLRTTLRRSRSVSATSTPPAPAPVPALVGADVVLAGGHLETSDRTDHPHHDHHDHGHGHHEHGHHEHGHHEHDHGAGWHDHEHVDLDAVASGAMRWREVLLPGLAGGLVPSPSALLVFLGGLALGRAWFGIALVFGYGIGIAATLVTAGWLLARAGSGMAGAGALDRHPRLARAAALLPATTAVLVIAGGIHIAARALV